MDVGARVKELRQSSGLSGNQLAKLAGIAQTSVSAIELGKVAPTTEMLGRICDALGISLADFFNDGANEIPVDIHRLMLVAKELTEEQRAILTSFIASITSAKSGKFNLSNNLENEGGRPRKMSKDHIPTVEQIAAHFEGEYGVYDEELARHVVEQIKLAQDEYDTKRGKGNTQKRG